MKKGGIAFVISTPVLAAENTKTYCVSDSNITG